MPEIRLSVPARAEFIHVLRVVTTGVGTRLDLPYDGLEEMRILVDEACSRLLDAGAPTMLELLITPGDGMVQLLVSSDADAEQWPPAGIEGTLSWQVMTTLADSVQFEHAEEGPAVRIVKRFGRGASDP